MKKLLALVMLLIWGMMISIPGVADMGIPKDREDGFTIMIQIL